MGHPACLLAWHASEQKAGLGDAQLGAPELAHLGLLDAPAQLVHEQLHAVADPHHRHAQLEQAALQAGSPVGVDRRGPAREDDAARAAARHLLERHVVGQKLAEDPAVADAARDQLAVLPAVVEHYDLLLGRERRGGLARGRGRG